jgi:RNA polymerase sigma-70 factor (ECF subfamily)
MANYEALDDLQLTGLLRSGDHAAFTEIHNRFWEILINAAYQRLKSREAAEEAVQDIFVSLYVRREEVRPKGGLEAYLKTALKFKVIDAYRAQQTYYTHLDSIIYESKLQSAEHDQESEIREMRNRINIAAAKMPEKCREVFLLSKMEQLSQQEIADRLDISVSTVKKHIHKALGILRDEFPGKHGDLLIIGFYVFLYLK